MEVGKQVLPRANEISNLAREEMKSVEKVEMWKGHTERKALTTGSRRAGTYTGKEPLKLCLRVIHMPQGSPSLSYEAGEADIEVTIERQEEVRLFRKVHAAPAEFFRHQDLVSRLTRTLEQHRRTRHG